MTDRSRFDVVVVGGGPAGMAAAIAASRGTSSVAIIDENHDAGGQIWRRDVRAGYGAAARDSVAALAASPVTLVSDASVVDAMTSRGRHRLVIACGGKTFVMETATLILATGARELFLPFPGWTLPGVLGVGGAQAMVKAGMRVAGRRIVVAGSGPLLAAVAASLASRGADIVAFVEQAPLRKLAGFGLAMLGRPRLALDALTFAQQLPAGAVRLGAWVSRAEGRESVESAVIDTGREQERVECDLVCSGYGLVPGTELARLLGCIADDDGIRVDERMRTSVEGILAAGECAGIAGVDCALAEGQIAGAVAVGDEPDFRMLRRRARARAWGRSLDRAFELRPEVLHLARPDTIFCRCEDVRLGAIASHRSSREAKLHSRVGMGACQGRICGAAARRIFGWTHDAVRPPLQPLPLSAISAATPPDQHGAN